MNDPTKQTIVAPATDWLRLGTEARIAERPHTENPLLGLGEMPEITGEDGATWRRNRDLWWEGWEAEDRRRAARAGVENERRSR